MDAKKIETLRKVERELRLGFNKSRGFYFETKRGNALETRWNKIMTDLRGWGLNGEIGQEMKSDWVEWCEANGIVPYYDMSDVLC